MSSQVRVVKDERNNPLSFSCISHEFFRAASSNPNKVAIVHASRERGTVPATGNSIAVSSHQFYDGDHCFTYSHLLSSVRSFTTRLRNSIDVAANALQPQIIGIYIPPSVEYVASVLSVLSCGQAFLPLDPFWPTHRVLSVLASSNVSLVVASKSPFGVKLSNSSLWLVDGRCPCPVLWLSFEQNGDNQVGQPGDLVWPCECENGRQRSFCYVLYTSGSTGKPKSVCGTEQGLLNRFCWMQELYPLHGEEFLLFKTSISFIDHLQEFLSSILTACTLVIPPSDYLKENLFYVIDFIKAYSIARLTAVPSLMRLVYPGLKDQFDMGDTNSLKLLVLSGETLPLTLWEMLSKILPGTSILNLYGSTEVWYGHCGHEDKLLSSGNCDNVHGSSGYRILSYLYGALDCTYMFRLSMILESETLTSVPIGVPIANCDVVLAGEDDLLNHGEIYVAGLCNSIGYYSDSAFKSLDYTKLPQDCTSYNSLNSHGGQLYFKTGDFARRLHGGDLVFLGRKDRTIKLQGHRIALEEIDDILRGHPEVVDTAVISCKEQGEGVRLVAFIVLKDGGSSEIFRSNIKSWMIKRVPSAMLPHDFIFTKSLPLSSTGKVDYELLASSSFSAKYTPDGMGNLQSGNLLKVIKKAFSDALMVEEISDDDDFFMLGGSSITAAHLSNNLGIDLRFLYYFPSPSKLCKTLLTGEKSFHLNLRKDANQNVNLEESEGNIFGSIDSKTHSLPIIKSDGRQLRTLNRMNKNCYAPSKRLKLISEVDVTSEELMHINYHVWNSTENYVSCSFSRCNKVLYEGEYGVNDIHQANCIEAPKSKTESMHELWKVYMGSCVDASPLIVFKGMDIYLFMGSHSHEFMCINARSGSVQWKIKLEGRIEGSAAILGDFSQVVVGCYKGKIYFIDSSNGSICWTYQTSGEVKSQPVIDVKRQLIWCGSHDHNLYALDYKCHCCVYKVPCGGSIYGSPVIDEVNGTVYVASTSGRLTAISVEALPFNILWQQELEVPVFGSLAISSLTGTTVVICCLVDGHVSAFDFSGSIIWKHKICGHIFAGACISSALPSQVLVCSRNGSIYSFELEKGNILWEYNLGDPIAASAYVDEHLYLTPDPSHLSDRLICVCSSSGSIYLIRVHLDETSETHQQPNFEVEKFGRFDLGGELFSSPVMIAGRIFVGCRDDYVHCVTVQL